MTAAELQVALLEAAQSNPDAHPALRDAMATAEHRLRERRAAMLTATTGGVPVTRRKSHNQRVGMLTEATARRSVDLDMAVLNKSMRMICKDFRCQDCSSTASYKSVCLTFMLNCLSVRIQERLFYDQKNGYAIEDEITEVMTSFVANPLRFWKERHDDFANLPSMLERMHYVIVSPPALSDDAKHEAHMYETHVASIRKVIELILRCERATVNA